MRKILYCLLFAVILVSCDDSVIKPEEYISKAVLEDFHNRYPGVKYNTVIGSDGDATFTVIDELGCKEKVHYYEGKWSGSIKTFNPVIFQSPEYIEKEIPAKVCDSYMASVGWQHYHYDNQNYYSQAIHDGRSVDGDVEEIYVFCYEYEGKSYFLVIDSEGTVLERKDDHLIRQDNRFLPDKKSHYLKARSMAQEKHPSATIKGMVFYSGAFVLYLSEGYSIFTESFRYGECDPCYDKQ